MDFIRGIAGVGGPQGYGAIQGVQGKAAQAGPVEADPNAWARAAHENLQQRDAGWRGIAGNEMPREEKTGGGIDDANITDAELQRLFGSEAANVRQLLNTRNDLRVKDLLPLRKDPSGLSATTNMLLSRTDLKIDDLMTRDRDGKVTLNPTLRDDNSVDLLKNRNDIKPLELSNMSAFMARAFKNPALARQAYTKSLDLLKTRNDLKPGDVTQMVGKMANAVQGAGGGPEGGAALMGMFDTASDLLKTRTDLGAKDINQLVDSTSKTFGGKDPMAMTNLTQGFDKAAGFLKDNKGAGMGDMTGVMDTLQKRMPGDGSGPDRLAALDKATQLMGADPKIGAAGVDTMMQKAAEGPPPLKESGKLLKAFESASDDVMSGRTNRETALTRRSEQTNTQVRDEKAALDERRVREGRPRTQAEEKERNARMEPGASEGKNASTAREGTLAGLHDQGAEAKPKDRKEAEIRGPGQVLMDDKGKSAGAGTNGPQPGEAPTARNSPPGAPAGGFGAAGGGTGTGEEAPTGIGLAEPAATLRPENTVRPPGTPW